MKQPLGIRAVLLLLVAILILPVCLIAIRTSISEQQNALEKARIGLVNQVQVRASSQLQFVEGARSVLTTIAHAAQMYRHDARACAEFLRDVNERLPQYASLRFADPSGNLNCRSASDDSVLSVADRQYFIDAARTGQFSVGNDVENPPYSKQAIVFALPAYHQNGDFHGVHLAVVNLSEIEKQYAALPARGEIIEIITDADGTILGALGDHALKVAARLPDGFLLRAIRARQPEVSTGVDDRAQEWLYAVQPVRSGQGSAELVASSMISMESVLSPARHRLQQTLILLLLIATVASLVAWRLGDRLLAVPIERLQIKIKGLEQDGPEAAHSPGSDTPRIRELRRIDKGINRLALALAIRSAEWRCAMKELNEQKDLAERRERRYRAQFEASPQPMWVFDMETLTFLVVNDAAIIHYGYSREEFAKMTLMDIRPPEDMPKMLENLALSRSEMQEAIFARHRKKTGEIIFVEAATHTLDWDGRPGCVAIIYDITSREMAKQAWIDLNRTLEQSVARRTRELALANEELEAFSYSVSHDLRGPLHIIDGFCAALLEKHHNTLPVQATHYLERIRAGTQQMNALIADLLALAKTSQTPPLLQEVNLAPLAIDIVSQLRLRFPEREVSVFIEEPLPAVCDRGLLKIVLENLIGNAWKFTSRTPQATIRIGRVAETETESTYAIFDNGAGFDPRHAAKLFKPFQRLHSVREFDGTGIGLATVYRIIRRHQGSVRAESSPGAGATFYFTLPLGKVL